MSNPMRFRDHTAFHLEVLRVTVTAAAFFAVQHLLSLVVPLSGRLPQTLLWAAGAALLGLMANPPSRKTLFTAGLLAAGIGLLGALCQQALPAYPWFGVGVYGLSIGIIASRDARDFRRYLTPLATGLSVALATYVVGAFRSGVDFASYVPPFLAEPGYGAVYGFLTSIGLLTRQLSFERDPVQEAFDRIKPTLGGEMLELSERAVALYGRIQQVLRDLHEKGNEAEPKIEQVSKSLVLKVIHLGPKWNEVEREAGRTSADDLVKRVEGLDKKIDETTDEVARKQYRMAREALGSQLRYLQDIGRSRERVIARVHNYLATLERLHLAVVNHRGADAAKLSDEIAPILDEIETIGHEMDYASEAIAEVSEASETAKKGEPRGLEGVGEGAQPREGGLPRVGEGVEGEGANGRSSAPGNGRSSALEEAPAAAAAATEAAAATTAEATAEAGAAATGAAASGEAKPEDKPKDPESSLYDKAFD